MIFVNEVECGVIHGFRKKPSSRDPLMNWLHFTGSFFWDSHKRPLPHSKIVPWQMDKMDMVGGDKKSGCSALKGWHDHTFYWPASWTPQQNTVPMMKTIHYHVRLGLWCYNFCGTMIWHDANFPIKIHNMVRCRRREQMVQSHLNESFGSYHSTSSKQFQLSNESGNSARMNGIHPKYFPDSDIYGLFGKPRKESPVFWQKRLLWFS